MGTHDDRDLQLEDGDEMVSLRVIESGGKSKKREIETREVEETVAYRRVESNWDPPCHEMRDTGDGPHELPDAELGEIDIENIQHDRISTIMVPNENGQQIMQVGAVLDNSSGVSFVCQSW